jgi:hypothetical protein
MAVKNHLHSSSGVREVVLSTIYSLFATRHEQPLDNEEMDGSTRKVNGTNQTEGITKSC